MASSHSAATSSSNLSASPPVPVHADINDLAVDALEEGEIPPSGSDLEAIVDANVDDDDALSNGQQELEE